MRRRFRRARFLLVEKADTFSHFAHLPFRGRLCDYYDRLLFGDD